MKAHQSSFLADIADYYTGRPEGAPPLSSMCFVLPNKRSVLFLKKHIHDNLSRVTMMPRFMTMRTFMSIHSHFPEAHDRELLFILYNSYCKVLKESGNDEPAEFDSFIFWADIILSDFDDLDRSLANADELFRNLKNLKEIQANFLDDEQKELVRRIWGNSSYTNSNDDFWLHIDHQGHNDPESLAGKFVTLWEILGSLYRRFHSDLEAMKLASVGAQYRQAADYFGRLSPADAAPGCHFVFVGFNDLSTAELVIFKRLKDLGLASFFWDTAPLGLLPENGDETCVPHALVRLRRLSETFPPPEDFTVTLPESLPAIEVRAIPSNIGQAKNMGRTLGEWTDRKWLDTSSPHSGAVIVPDPSLLMPVLFSIPEKVEKINISLGLPYRSTTFASLLRSIVSMQLRTRNIGGKPHFYFEDVMAVLTHPHIRMIAPVSSQKMSEEITEKRMFNISAESVPEELAAVFTPVRPHSGYKAVAVYLTALLDRLAAGIAAVDGGLRGHFELEAIKYFREETTALAGLIEKYGVSMRERTFFHLFERLFASRALSLKGTPLQGLQVLGVLETRALDFDNVAILSMNERIFPRRQYTRTMIPGSLRGAFGLPEFDSLESTYAYCFYRLLARAKHVTLFYDSRTEALGNGEISRYVSQMRYLMPALNVDITNVSPAAVPSDKGTVAVPKTPEVMSRLEQLKPGGDIFLSASALKTYIRCPLQFYLQYVGSMRGSDELADYISASDFGTIVHNSIQELTKGYEGCLIDRSFYDRLLQEDNRTIERTVLSKVVDQCYQQYRTADGSDPLLPAEGMLCVEVVTKMVRNDLAAERDYYGHDGFTYITSEEKHRGPWKISDKLTINFTMSIDRVDRIDAGKLRFIDFKTGDEETSATLDKVFSGGAEGIFQVLTYCEAYAAMEKSELDIVPMIHPRRMLNSGEPLVPVIVDKSEIKSYRQISDKFMPRLREMLERIFDNETPFTQCENASDCRFCPFLSLCGRVVPIF